MGTNPYIKEIYKLYYESFESLEPYSNDRAENDVEYSEKLKDLVDRHADNIPTLARGKIASLIAAMTHDKGDLARVSRV